MLIPRYWAEASAPALSRWRHRVTLKRWGWSDDSQAAAQAHADERLRDALSRYGREPGVRARETRDAYNGAEGLPIREEVLDQRAGAVLTRNSYGAQCLNTPDVLFVDVDHAPLAMRANGFDFVLWLGALWLAMHGGLALFKGQGETALACALALAGVLAVGRVRRLLRRRTLARQKAQQEPRALARVRGFFARHPDWAARVYRTPAGLRVLVTHRPFDPLTPEVAACFEALGADAVYRLMCQRQRCFRARVSAKPWRAGIREHLPPSWSGAWPVKPAYAAQRAAWVKRYAQVARGFAACQLIEHLGPRPIHPAVMPVLNWHDDLSRARSALPLA